MSKEQAEQKRDEKAKKADERNCTGTTDKKGKTVCGHDRFKTVKKEEGVRITVGCRKCGTTRDVKEFDKALAEAKAA